MGQYLDYESVKNYIESFECELISENYLGNSDKLEIKFICGHIDNNKSFATFKLSKNKVCKKCFLENYTRKLKYEFIKESIEEYGCKLISEKYDGNKVPLEILFLCGHIDYRSYDSFNFKEKYCTKCISKSLNRVPRNSWNLESMNKYCEENNIEYTVLETEWREKEYQKQLWAFVKCPNKDHSSYWVWWNNFTKGYFCKECYAESNNIIFWDKEKIESFYKECGLKIIDFNQWKDIDSYVDCINSEGYYVRAGITNLKTYKENPKLGPNLFRGNKYAIENIKIFCKKERPDYKILSEKYLGIKELHLFEYIGLGLPDGSNSKFYATIDGFYHGRVMHPDLNKTRAELIIETFLIKNNIKYKFQYTNHDCRNVETGWKLKFDFGIFDEYGKLELIIESDGTSHDTIVEYWGGEESLLSLQKRDEIKNVYCKENNIKLLRINHKEDSNIENILEEALSLQERRINA